MPSDPDTAASPTAMALIDSDGDLAEHDRQSLMSAERAIAIRNGRFSVVVLGCAFFLIFMAFTVNLASTVLPPSVAYGSFGSLYIAFAFSNLFFAALAVEKIGTRASLFVASLTYMTMNVANVFAVHYTGGNDAVQFAILIPASILIGMGASVLWTAQGTFLSRCGPPETAGNLSGIFSGMLALAYIMGPLVSAILLQLNLDKNLMFVVLTVLGAGGPMILLYLWCRPEPRMPKSGDDQPAATKPASAWSTAQIMLNPSILLLIPFFMYYAIEKGFFSGIFPLLISTTSERSDLLTKLYLSAVWGCSDMLTSFLFGRATDYWGPEAMTWLLSGVQATAMIALWCVGPMNNLALLYPVAFLLGFCDALVVIQTFKLMQLLFPSDVDLAPAYSASWFVRAFFIGLAFVVSPATLAPGKVPRLTIWAPLIVALVVVMACGVSVAVRRRKRSQIVI